MRLVSNLLFTFLLMVLFFIVTVPIFAQESGTTDPESNMLNAASAVNAFAVDVYKQLAAEGGNIFFSPYGISSAMAMAYAGARGDSAAEMAKVLHFTEYKSGIHAAMKSLHDRINSIIGEIGVFSVANKLWLDNREGIISDYSTLVEANYGVYIASADFFDAFEKTRLEINEWVAQNTRNTVKNILQPGDVNVISKLILVNAVYFNFTWQEPFDKSLTAEEPFRINKNEERSVHMMRRIGYIYYGENLDAQWIKIPYSIPGFYMAIFLPRENESFTQLEELEKKLTQNELELWLSDVQYNNVEFSIPKFKDRSRFNLVELLQKLGMNMVFDWRKADFSGMVEEPRVNDFALCISDAIHQSFITLDEDKTEGINGADVAMETGPINKDSNAAIQFHAVHPFIYCVTDSTGAILFMGRMVNP
jgi:serpin B